MRSFRFALMSVAVLSLLLIPAAAADCGKHADAEKASGEKACCAKKAAEAKADAPECCQKKAAAHAAHADHADHAGHADHAECKDCSALTAVAASAAGGCSKSTAKLIAMAKESGCPEGFALATKAEAGDEKALAALISNCSGKTHDAHHADSAADHHGAEAAMLAANAKSGCSKSAAKLVAMAKGSGCPKGEALAAKAEAGDEEAQAEIIAMFIATDE